jgi:hypothetical protein
MGRDEARLEPALSNSRYLDTLTDDTKRSLRRLVEAAYLDGEPDGPRSYAATAWAVKGHVP